MDTSDRVSRPFGRGLPLLQNAPRYWEVVRRAPFPVLAAAAAAAPAAGLLSVGLGEAMAAGLGVWG